MTAAAPTPTIACARCRGPIEHGDLRCAICGVAAPVAQDAPAQMSVQILRCTECGAAVSFSAEAQAPRCKFCGSVTRLEQPVDPVEQAEWILPFAVTPEQAQGAVRQWLSGLGFFRPSDLAATATVEGLQPIWWAGWMVNANAGVSWAADSNAGTWRSAWAPHSGQVALPFRNLLVSASRGLALGETSRIAPYIQLATAQPVSAAPTAQLGPAGATLEQFDTQRSAARRMIVDAITATAAQSLQQGIIPGSTFRNVHIAVLLEALETRRVAVPSYVLAYRYRKALYRAVVHGQDARCVLGKAPYSIAKILLVAAIVLLVVVGILTAIALFS
jgi:hypothetical protein